MTSASSATDKPGKVPAAAHGHRHSACLPELHGRNDICDACAATDRAGCLSMEPFQIRRWAS